MPISVAMGSSSTLSVDSTYTSNKSGSIVEKVKNCFGRAIQVIKANKYLPLLILTGISEIAVLVAFPILGVSPAITLIAASVIGLTFCAIITYPLLTYLELNKPPTLFIRMASVIENTAVNTSGLKTGKEQVKISDKIKEKTVEEETIT